MVLFYLSSRYYAVSKVIIGIITQWRTFSTFYSQEIHGMHITLLYIFLQRPMPDLAHQRRKLYDITHSLRSPSLLKMTRRGLDAPSVDVGALLGRCGTSFRRQCMGTSQRYVFGSVFVQMQRFAFPQSWSSLCGCWLSSSYGQQPESPMIRPLYSWLWGAAWQRPCIVAFGLQLYDCLWTVLHVGQFSESDHPPFWWLPS